MSKTIRVVVAIDGSKSSEGTLQTLAKQVKPTDADVRVLHVVEPFTFSASPQMAADYAPELEAKLKDARVLVERAAKTLGALEFKVTTEVREGDIREMIIESAKGCNADLIVVGSRGHKGLSRLVLGSVAEAVARHSPCSVEVVRAPATIRRALLVVDASKFSEAAAQALVQQLQRRVLRCASCVWSICSCQFPLPTRKASAG